MKQACVCVFAKAPVKGRVKTRLFPSISEQQACDVHEKLLEHCLSNTHHDDWQRQLWSTDTQHPFIQSCEKKYSIPLCLQQGSDLGEKMYLAASESLKTFSYVIIIGTDCPTLNANYISEAVSRLKAGANVVLGPAVDGGYVLIGLSVDIESIFKDMQWGNEQVLSHTRQRLREAGISWEELAVQRDIDRPEDLDFLKQLQPSWFIRSA